MLSINQSGSWYWYKCQYFQFLVCLHPPLSMDRNATMCTTIVLSYATRQSHDRKTYVAMYHLHPSFHGYNTTAPCDLDLSFCLPSVSLVSFSLVLHRHGISTRWLSLKMYCGHFYDMICAHHFLHSLLVVFPIPNVEMYVLDVRLEMIFDYRTYL